MEVLVLEGNGGITDAFCSRLAEAASTACPADLQIGQTGITGTGIPVLGRGAGAHRVAVYHVLAKLWPSAGMQLFLKHAFNAWHN